LVSIMGGITGCLWENQVRSKLLKPLDKSVFSGFGSVAIFAEWSLITALACPNLFATLSSGCISSNFGENYQMKIKEETKIKKRAPFQRRNRLGLPDESFCVSGEGRKSTII